jgi:Icc-related predicted phosphoesterase
MAQLESAANLRRRYSDIDLVISCGDMPAAYLEFIISVLNVPLFYVRGNHDEGYDHNPPGGENLHRRVVSYNGLRFAGLEGSMKYNDGRIQYTEAQMSMMVAGMAAGLGVQRVQKGYGLDVLVTHSPAWKIHDADDLPHTGFKALLNFMRWYRPRYMLHGHVHTYDRRKTTITKYNNTCIVNINPITVLEIDEHTQTTVCDAE